MKFKHYNQVTGYHAGNSIKQRFMIEQFLAGAKETGDKVGIAAPPQIPAKRNVLIFFGLSLLTNRMWKAAVKRDQHYVYIDNSYFGPPKDRFRITNDAVSASDPFTHPGADSKGRRFQEIGLHIKPWQSGGGHVLLCLQSELYFKLLVGERRVDWIEKTCTRIREFTDRRIVIREKPNRQTAGAPIEQALQGCHCIVTWNSTAAIEAIFRGIPAICLDPMNSFRSVCSTDLSTIENPRKSPHRLELLHWLADNQWSKEEIRNGKCWTILKAQW